MPDNVGDLLVEARATTFWRETSPMNGSESVPKIALDLVDRLADALSAARAVIEEAKAAHRPIPVYTSGSTDPAHVPDRHSECVLCGTAWPCLTVAILSKFPSNGVSE